MHVAGPVFADMTKPDYADPCLRIGCKPLFDQIMQGLLGGVHGPLLDLAPRSLCLRLECSDLHTVRRG